MSWWEEPYTPYCFGNFRNIKYLYYYCQTCDFVIACSRVRQENFKPKQGKLWKLARLLYALTLGKFIPLQF